MRISNSKSNTYRRCQKKYEYKYVRKLEPKKKSRPLTLGSWMHDLIEAWHKGENWLDIHRAKKKEWANLFEEEREELGDIPGDAQRLMVAYIRHYKGQDDDLFVVDSEIDELVTLPNGDQFNFIIDLVVIENEGVWLWDHKNVKSFMDDDYMLLDSQLARYFWAAQKLGYDEIHGYPLRGVCFNEIRTKAPTVPQLLKNGSLSKAKKIDTDYYTYLSAIKKHGLNPADYVDILRHLRNRDLEGAFFRRTRMPKDEPTTRQMMIELEMTLTDIKRSEKHNHFPRTVLKSCAWDCDYKDLCITELHGGDTTVQERTHFRKREKRGD